MITVCSSPCPVNLDSSLEVDSQTDYLKIAKKGGGHKGTDLKQLLIQLWLLVEL